MSADRPQRLTGGALAERVARLALEAPDWTKTGDHLVAEWKFADFAGALAWVNRLGELAEELGHHPDLELGWGKVRAKISSHDAGGLTAADFEFAERAQSIEREPSAGGGASRM